MGHVNILWVYALLKASNNVVSYELLTLKVIKVLISQFIGQGTGVYFEISAYDN